MELLHGLLRSLVDVAIVLFEFIGVFVSSARASRASGALSAAIR